MHARGSLITWPDRKQCQIRSNYKESNETRVNKKKNKNNGVPKFSGPIIEQRQRGLSFKNNKNVIYCVTWWNRALCNIKHRESSDHSSYSQVNWTQHSKVFFLLMRVFCCTSFHWLLFVVIYSTQNSVQHIRRVQSPPLPPPPPPLPSAPKGLALKEIQLHKNSFSFYGEGKRIQKDFLIPRGAQPPINQLVMKVSFPTRRRQRENRTHQALSLPRLNACKNFYEEGRDGVS